MTLRILTDLHHHALAESLLLLFEDRFDFEVWFPTGMGWFDEGVWNFERAWHGDAVARQYLLGVWDTSEQRADGTVRRHDPRHIGRVQKGIPLHVARDQRWDLVISSLPHNDEGFHAFAQQTGARFGVQVGNNVQQSRWDLADFVLSSSTLPESGLVHPDTWGKVASHHGVPCVVYHQEFSLDTFHPEWPPADRRTVASFVNCFPETPPYGEFLRFARAHSDDFDFKVYGAYGSGADDEFKAGDVSVVTEVADAMRACRVGYHTKVWSDGYGHVIHDWFAIGRPVVGVPRYYADKLAGPLFIEGVTSFDIESRSEHELATLLRRLRDDDDYHQTISESAAKRFREVVDFDGEARAIRQMLEAVL